MRTTHPGEPTLRWGCRGGHSATAFFVLGRVSLDWDGLNWVENKGYLTGPPKGGYLPTARQAPPRDAVRQLYWGSHNYHDRAAVTTFGDHYSLPRPGLPDLFWRMNLEGPEPVKSKARRAAEGLVRRHAAAVMLAVRDGPRRVADLVRHDELDRGRYEGRTRTARGASVREERERRLYRHHPCPHRAGPLDGEGASRSRAAGVHDVVRRALRAALRAARRHHAATYGLPLSDSFYWVWHPVFGVANRELVKAGLFADPYSSDRTFQGFIPAVYQLDVVQGPF